MGVSYVTYKVTLKCNYNCDFCYQSRDFDDDLAIDEVKKAISKIRREGCDMLLLSGGEPLMRPDIEEIISYATKEGLNTKMATNGVLLSKSKLASLADAGLDDIYISVGDMTDTNRLEILRRTKEMFKDCGIIKPILGVNVITSKSFVINIDKYMEWLEKLGIKVVFLLLPKPGLDNSWFERERLTLPLYLKLCKDIFTWKEKFIIHTDCSFLLFRRAISSGSKSDSEDEYKCPGGKNGFLLDNEGYVYPCSRFDEGQFCAGSILHKDIESFMQSDGFERFYNVLKKESSLFPPCLQKVRKH
ncbi:radical SAM protein [Ruminiclostridium herbifermentans]|uniref:Radical SAM protein n=1 Tax=Ruminiclostridium herbifermentans TaxID=2488810 RepID=A0A4U7JHU7_9FIRM|nr:radical SAM protein [Ruminiclostridium herbifermentans]QNU66184.1 radical SAM protein [Ruminiclostridium herbifermentans]